MAERNNIKPRRCSKCPQSIVGKAYALEDHIRQVHQVKVAVKLSKRSNNRTVVRVDKDKFETMKKEKTCLLKI